MKTLIRLILILFVLAFVLPIQASAQGELPPKPDAQMADPQVSTPLDEPIASGELPKGGSPAGPPWTVQRIDDRHYFSDGGAPKHNLKIDTNGNPHIVYGGDHLYHTWWNNIWYTEVVDPALHVGSYASLAIDGANKLHIAYYDADNGDLKYAHNKFGYWSIFTVVSAGDVGAGTDIAVDAAGDPVIVYRDSTNGKLMAVWLQQDNMYDPPEIISGSVYPSGNFAMAKYGFGVDVVFYNYSSSPTPGQGTLYYTSTRTSIRWMPKIVDYGYSQTGKAADLKIDSTGKPHVVYGYADEWNQWTRHLYSTNYGDTWISPFGDNDNSIVSTYLPVGLALALTSDNQPIVAFQSGTTLYKFTWNTSLLMWDQEQVDPGTGTGFFPAVAVYPASSSNANKPAFAYLDDPAGKQVWMNYREIYGASWWPTAGPAKVDQSEAVGNCSTSLTGPDGNPWVIYSGDTTHNLYFKRFYNGVWQAPSSIGGGTYAGQIYCEHAAAVGGGKAGVLFAAESGPLLYSTITCTGSSCSITPPVIVEASLSNPKFTDVTLDSSGYAHIVYNRYSGGFHYLIYKRNTGGVWTEVLGPQITGSSEIMPLWWRTVSVKKSGAMLYVAYEKEALVSNIAFVYFDGSQWSTPLVLSNTNSSSGGEEIDYGCSLSLNPSGMPGVAYTSMYLTGGVLPPSRLLFRQRSCGIFSCSWTDPVLMVDTWGDDGAFRYPSLVTDAQGRYRISYVQVLQDGSRFLQYVRVAGTSEFRPVYIYPGLGEFSSLALASTGAGRISFADKTNGDLLFAWQNLQIYLPMVRR